jgi:hypothetical protein
MAANNLRISLTFAAALALVPVTAKATISRAMQFDDKVENAATIVLGKVVSQQSQWDASRSRILTYSTFHVEKTLKGANAQQVTVITPGGVVGDVAQEFVGVPRFAQGDEHVVFVRNTKAGPTVLYFDQGAYRVAENDRGDRIVHPLVSNAVLVDTQRGTAVAPERPRTLREFEGEIRGAQGRREAYRMKMLEKQRQEASLTNQLRRNAPLVILALLGALFATWQFFKRS